MRLNLSAEGRARHEEFLVGMFSCDVHVITEWKDGCVWATKKVGTVVAFVDKPPIRPNVPNKLVRA